MRRGPGAVLGLGLAVVLAVAMSQLPDTPEKEAPPVLENLERSGVDHPVTAVLLNFRGYDTWLEVGVLVVATLALLTLHRTRGLPAAPIITALRNPVVNWVARLLVPIMLLVGGYLIWLGTRSPGGAFQAGAVLGAAGVLARLAGIGDGLNTLMRGWPLRFAAILGFGFFLLVAAGTLLGGSQLLDYPSGSAGALIFAIEAAVTASIGWTLAFLYAGASPRRQE